MSKNYICEGDRLDYTNTTGVDIKSGDPVLIVATLGVAYTDIPDELTRTVMIEGVYEIRKGTGAIAQGAKAYWDADGNPVGAVAGNGLSGTGCLTTTADGNTYAGIAYAAAASGDATVQLKLNA